MVVDLIAVGVSKKMSIHYFEKNMMDVDAVLNESRSRTNWMVITPTRNCLSIHMILSSFLSLAEELV